MCKDLISSGSNAAESKVVRAYQNTCFDAGYSELNNPPFSYESQGRVATPFDTHTSVPN